MATYFILLIIYFFFNTFHVAVQCFSQSKIERKISYVYSKSLLFSKSKDSCDSSSLTEHRRTFLSKMIPTFALLQQPQISSATVTTESKSPNAALFSPDKILSTEDSKYRFKNAQTELQYLLDNYSSISEGGGDNIRRYLGTVGTTSNLYGIRKVMKVLQKEAEDIVEYTETMNDFESSLQAADTACYSANFVEFSAATTKPEKFFDDAKGEVKRMIAAMVIMGKELSL